MGIKNKINHFLFILLFLSPLVFAQTEISGKVTAASGEILPGASVLLNDKDHKIAAFAITGNSGSYVLAVKQPGAYTLEANFLGYKQQDILVTVLVTDKTITKNFILKEDSALLTEVLIETETPVKRRGDTLTYDAKALGTGHEVVVEDLLKNIPGITVQKDGTINMAILQ